MNHVIEIENLVNYHILRNEPVETNEMAVEEAMRSGAMALFGEKYGEKVRVLSIKGAEDIFSKELCGGTHVRATGDIGPFVVVAESGVAAGVRRVEALTGMGAVAWGEQTVPAGIAGVLIAMLPVWVAVLGGGVLELPGTVGVGVRPATWEAVGLAPGPPQKPA